MALAEEYANCTSAEVKDLSTTNDSYGYYTKLHQEVRL